MQDIPQQSPYHEELLALQPIVIGGDWDTLDKLLKRQE
jgi:hypothetical protein